MRLAEAARAVHGTLRGADREFTGVVSDSRAVCGGELFVALPGTRVDGHDYAGAAAERGAAAVLASRQPVVELPSILVDDTVAALGRLAGHWRSRFDIPVVAITGSNGKTTVKEMVGAIMGARSDGLITAGNLNNHIGLPLTLLGMRAAHRFAVVELAMNHAGEIRYLTRLAQPTVALVNNAAPAHLEGVGSVAAVARAKAEIFEGLRPGGVAVINADDAHCDLWLEATREFARLTFGLSGGADVSATVEPCAEGQRVLLLAPAGRVEIVLALPGLHNVANALAASAAALAAGARLEDVRAGLGRVKSVPGRMQPRLTLAGGRVFDDTYNANPASLRAGLEVLRGVAGERFLVLGDMAELGDESVALHIDAGQLARAMGVDRLLAIGRYSRHAAEAFGEGAEHFEDADGLAQALRTLARPGTTVLVKGSRRMRMERVVEAVCGPTPAAGGR